MNKKIKTQEYIDFIIKIIKGMIIGLATITAGAGTFAIILGIYDKCMEIIAKPFKNFKQNLIYIFPIVLGIAIGFFIFKNPVIHLFEEYPSYVKCIFFGIILGGTPTLLKQANKNGKDKKYGITFFLAFVLTLLATYIGNRFTEGNENSSIMKPVHMVIYGMIYGFGAIMPGMTTLHVLIFLGVWGKIISGITSFNCAVIIPFAVGYLVMILLTANLMSYCFKKYYGYTYYAIIGFSVTSLIMLLPHPINIIEGILSVFLLLISFLIMYYISQLESRIKKEDSII